MNFGKSQLRWTHTEMKEKIARHTRPMGYKIIKLIYFELLSDKHGAHAEKIMDQYQCYRVISCSDNIFSLHW